jgi:tetratricopeptide (TPR) repeat protein
MTASGRQSWVFAGACALAVATIVGAYSNSFENSFHFDDSHVVEGNLYIRSLKNIPTFFRDAATFTSLPANATFRPLVTTTLALDYWLGGGLKPWQFHLTQLTMLLLLGVMLFVFFRRLLDMAEEHSWNRYAALLAAVLFSAHTTNTETLNLMHARSELLSAIGVVGSFLVYFFLPRSRRTHLYLLPMIVGALAKSPAVMFAPLFFVYLVLFEQRLSIADLFSSRSRRGLREAIRKSLPALIVGALVFLAVNAMDAPTATYGGGSRVDYLRTQFFVWLHYGRLFFLPVGLTADTDWGRIAQWYDTRVIAGILFVAFLLRVLWRTSKTPALRPIAFGIAWFGLALLPASSVVPLAEVSNEHRVFFPYIGLSLAVVWGMALLVERWSMAAPRLRPVLTQAAAVLAILVVSGHAVGTYERNKVWRSEETLWRDVTEKSPANGRGLMNYGLTQMARGKYEDARRLFERAAIYNPNYATLEINLGIVTGRLGQPAVAESHFLRALQLQPNDPSAHSFYARWLAEGGAVDKAIPHLERAIALSPAILDARYQLLGAYARTGRAAELKALAAATLTMAPGDPIAGQYLNDRGEVAAERIAPAAVETATGLLNASLHRYQSGDFEGSIDAASRALKLKPDYAEAHNNMAASFAALRQWDEAIREAREALRLKPDFPLARNNLAWAEAEKRKADQGVELASQKQETVRHTEDH